ncbi:MAG: hypothetical protein FK731_15040 [Asgard group archaeon]|nr:hypothetical protein [Asgard group archaeon]
MKKITKLFGRVLRNPNAFCFWPFAILQEIFRIFILKSTPDDVSHCCCNCCLDACCQDTCGKRRSCIRCG